MRLADIYQQFQVHDEVVQCLNHKDEKVKTQAIVTLGRIADTTTANILIKHYPEEGKMNKIVILKVLAGLAGEEHSTFLTSLLNDPDKDIKLYAASAIVRTSKEGRNILEQKALAGDDEELAGIFKHVTDKSL